MKNKKEIKLIEKFQCVGCINGKNTKCGKFLLEYDTYIKCKNHVLGTIGSYGYVALGLPQGFCIAGFNFTKNKYTKRNVVNIRLWKKGTKPKFNYMNIPVWVLETKGFLFVRTFTPRIDMSWIDIIEGGKLSLTPNAINIGKFTDERN